MRSFAQLMMRKTEIVGTSDQIHPRLKRSEATGSMAGFARQAGQPFPEGSIQALDKSCIVILPRSRRSPKSASVVCNFAYLHALDTS